MTVPALLIKLSLISLSCILTFWVGHWTGDGRRSWCDGTEWGWSKLTRAWRAPIQTPHRFCVGHPCRWVDRSNWLLAWYREVAFRIWIPALGHNQSYWTAAEKYTLKHYLKHTHTQAANIYLNIKSNHSLSIPSKSVNISLFIINIAEGYVSSCYCNYQLIILNNTSYNRWQIT